MLFVRTEEMIEMSCPKGEQLKHVDPEENYVRHASPNKQPLTAGRSELGSINDLLSVHIGPSFKRSVESLFVWGWKITSID